MGVMRAHEAVKEVVYMVPDLKFPERILPTNNRMVFCSLLQVKYVICGVFPTYSHFL